MSQVIQIKKGLDIQLQGKSEKVVVKLPLAPSYSVKPTDFPGLVARMLVKEGDTVKAGTALFCDKNKESIRFASPVSGTIQAVKRGDKRKLLEVIITPNAAQEYEEFVKPTSNERAELVAYLQQGGVWPFIRQRPYAVVADPQTTPKAIWVSCFDTAPLAPDYDYIFQDKDPDFQLGLDTLAKLTTGKVHLGIHADYPAAAAFSEAKGVEIHNFAGKHPTGNVGVQIHHVDPINKGEYVWYVQPQDVLVIGRLMRKGTYDVSKTIALCGDGISDPRYYKVIGGCSLKSIADKVKEGHWRYISGNVLTGTQVETDSHLGFYSDQITVIEEGDKHELFGWALPGFSKFSASRTFFSWLRGNKTYSLDTNLHGGVRAFVLSGNYEKVFPMDIYPEYLLKAILAGDIEKMEQLGIYEVAEEDFALCEFVCASKMELQAIIRQGIELMQKEMK